MTNIDMIIPMHGLQKILICALFLSTATESFSSPLVYFDGVMISRMAGTIQLPSSIPNVDYSNISLSENENLADGEFYEKKK